MWIRTTFSLIAVVLAVLAGANGAMAQQLAEGDMELLTLDRAVEIAVGGNRTLASAGIEVDRAADRLAVSRTRRLPQVNLTVLGSQNLTPINFQFEQGVFGTFPGIGPVPSTDTSISTGRQPTVSIVSQVAQPLSQLGRIRLGIDMARVGVDLAREEANAKKLDVVASVKSAYYAILLTQSSLESTEETIRMYAEIDRLTDRYLVQQVALKSDSLDVKARLAQSEYEALTLRDRLATDKERLNVLLGRDVETPFRVSPAPEYSLYTVDLASARSLALERRPEIRQARLRAEQAGYDLRIKKSERIPEVNLVLSHTSLVNYDSILPRHVASVGVEVKWEIFDWGRKRSEVSEKARARTQADLAVSEAQAQVAADVNQRFRALGQTRQLLRVARMRQEACREEVRVTAARYKAQVALLRDTLKAQTALADADARYQQALLSFWTAKADFDKALGGE